ncbi:TonB-dependent receptor [Sphingomonas sp. CFBP 13728]|nr:TonB-dependent receptor [Sphingomonas sp. CFBP 13728]
MMLPNSVAAQTAPSATDGTAMETGTQVAAEAAAAPENETIVVTGSRIARPNLDSPSPITSLSIQELTQTGEVSLGDTLNKLPSLRATFSGSNSTRFIGTAGINALDLRGLGTNRTLVLVNGRRHVTSTPGESRVDINTIPVDLIERVDVVTGGNSAVYGSDAVAGAVNFVLKRDYEGFRLRGQSGVTSRGDRPSYFGSLTAGKNFADGRGNIAVSAEYSESDALYFTDRARYSTTGRRQFNLTENVLNEPGSGNGVPDTTFLTNVRNIAISEGGAITSACPAAVAGNAAVAARRAFNCTGENSNTGAALGRVFVFDNSGNLVPNNVIKDFRPFGSGNAIGGLGSSQRLTGQLQPGIKRYSANVLAHYDVSDAFRPFVEAKYVRVDAIQEGQPTFLQGTLPAIYNVNNPFLTAQARSVLAQTLAPGATTFQAQRINVDFGARGENHRRETYRIVAGVEGTFNTDWRYEVAFNYGHLDTFYATQGNVNVQKFKNSQDAVRNAGGNIVCGINADASTANDDASCVPVNLFGQGAPSASALNYFVVNSTRRQKADQYDATAFVSGDLSQLFELPGGPVAFSIGGEYRRETAYSAFDDVTRSGATFLNAIPIFDPPAQVVKEAYGEIRIPLLKDVPFFQELTIDGAGRVSDYNIGATGTVYSYNAGLTWSPVRDIRLRGSYARSVRAPTQGDLFSAPSQTFLNGLVDPCSQNNIRNGPNRAANCAAAGVPTTQTFNGITEPFTNVPTSGISGLNGSNPNLREETADSFTGGFILQPSMIPGLTLSVDYYNIKITNVIFALAPQTIINQCYDSPSGINNQYCAALTRNPNGTFAGQTGVTNGGAQISFPATGQSFLSGPFNFAKQKTSGVDADLSYSHNVGGAKVTLRGIVSYLINRDNYTDINTPSFIDQQKFEVGDPEWSGSFTANVDFGVFDLNYNFRYVGKQTVAAEYETQNSVQGRPARDPDAFPFTFYPDVTYHNIRVGADVTDKFRFYAGMDNVFDRQPPYDITGTTGAQGIYENVGRFMYAGFEAKF